MEPQRSLRVLYIEGFSPGPGLPYPLLERGNFSVVKSRMPYGCGDHAKNPFGVLLVLTCLATLWVASLPLTFVPVLRSSLGGRSSFFFIKQLAVGYCLDCCIDSNAKMTRIHAPNVVIAYSWGGGISRAGC